MLQFVEDPDSIFFKENEIELKQYEDDRIDILPDAKENKPNYTFRIR